MKISLDWLNDFVDLKGKDPHMIADALTKGMGEVDEVEVRGGNLEKCVVGKITSVTKHPSADRLSLCDVETDEGVKRVVCGGTNVREGMLVAFAHVGATVKWHGGETMTLAPAKIRGEQSEGMICAAEELDLQNSFPPSQEDGERPIIDFSGKNWKAGTPLADALGGGDTILHIDNHAITNRPDLFSHVGVARECVALGLGKEKSMKKTKALSFPSTPIPFTMQVERAEMAPRYCACVIDIPVSGQTPNWMKCRLESVGIRSLSLPIDITNYVMMEYGLPLHSFDIADIRGNVRLRGAKEGEKIVTLDRVERTLPEGALVLADDDGIFDLLGIMGGLRSSTKESTRRIYLHAASIDPVAIRKTVIATGHRTDAATIYEKEVPPVTVEEGFRRAVALFLELIPGAKISSKLESKGSNGKAKPVTVDSARIQDTIGMDVSAARMKQILTHVGCTVNVKGKTMVVTPPLWRLHDITREADIVEEIARIVGYNAIPKEMPVADISPPARDTRREKLRDAMKERGFFELVHLSFASPSLLSRAHASSEEIVPIENPIGEELSVMRPSIVPQLLETAAEQRKEASGDLKLWEMGKVFAGNTEKDEIAALLLPDKKDAYTSLALKTLLKHAIAGAGYALTSKKDTSPSAMMHPGRAAVLLSGTTQVGHVFEVHPSVLAAFGLQGPCAIARIDATKLWSLPRTERTFVAPPVFPGISYDESILLRNRTAAELVSKARGAHALLTSVETTDVFAATEGERVTMRFTYRAPDRTLTENEVKPVHEKLLSSLS